MLHIATEDDIRSGKLTDVYFKNTCKVLKAKGIRKNVVMECAHRFSPSATSVCGAVALIPSVNPERSRGEVEGRPADASGRIPCDSTRIPLLTALTESGKIARELPLVKELRERILRKFVEIVNSPH